MYIYNPYIDDFNLTIKAQYSCPSRVSHPSFPHPEWLMGQTTPQK